MRRLPLAGKRLFLIIAIALKYELCIVLLVNYYKVNSSYLNR